MTLYIFYIKNKKGEITKTYSKFCKYPNKTKIGIRLKNMFNSELIYSYGWCVASKFNYNL